MSTIMEILSKPIEERKIAYNVKGRIDEVYIDGQKFSGYKAFSFLWEKSYHKEPTRSSDGIIGNLNDYTSFVTPHLKIDFSVMSIDDYRRIMQLVYSKNEFVVTCYDVVNNRMTTNKMYFSTEEMPKLFLLNRALNGEEWIELLGIDGYTVEMIGTNADLETVNVTYLNIEPTTGTFGETYVKDLYVGQEFIIGEGVEFKNDSIFKDGAYYTFEGMWRKYILDSNGLWQKTDVAFRDNTAITIHDNMVLGIEYLMSSSKPAFTVSLNYGYGKEVLDEYGNTIYTISIHNGDIFNLSKYTTLLPEVKFLGEKYTPYKFRGWYYTPVIADGSTSLDGTKFDKSHNVSIYQVYETSSYTLSFETNTTAMLQLDAMNVKYGETVAIPIVKKTGYKFVGWYYEPEFTNKFSGEMPPTNVTIYAKWEKEDD